ncbi:MAG: tRNA preQ1(34) S-adenosylmethionine ribosyltransferase-isomerase QueA [Paludibacteraceae bacterium]|nr:tRNA preQ1(34) S-adenosylmethionine ribosyltransferase-isomerase QueA [Paludibacteraceae bacterium]
MKLSQFKFKLPEAQIAQRPVENRDESRLLVFHKKSGQVEHRTFLNILEYFDEKDLLVTNDAKVFPAMLYGNKEKTNAKIEVTLLRELTQQQRLWDVLVEPARKIRVGNKLYFGDDNSMVAEVIDNTTSRGRTIRFLYDGEHDEFKDELMKLGHTPLPYYIYRENGSDADDTERYQTIYAQKEGAVVAPAAGLHFSRELLKLMEIKGIDVAALTLYCSLTMFKDVDVEDLTKYKMDSEQMEVPESTANLFNERYAEGRKICAVGTSTLRALETASTADGIIRPYDGWTYKFIFPPYQFSTANCLLTNFHLSQSTMLMIVASFGGYEKVMEIYNMAVKEGYRFGAYGDAMLILND